MLDSRMIYNYDYILKWKDIDVLQFNMKNKAIHILNRDYLPMSICNMEDSYAMVEKFCSDRVLMFDRIYCKEILTSCGIDNQTPVEICIICRALSFRDNYWISKKRENLYWNDINLYSNLFSNKIARVSLTGNYEYVEIGDQIFTGELTNKGSRAKCYIRKDNGLFLYKYENHIEIAAEILSFYISKAIGIDSSYYFCEELFDKKCSVCQILTDEKYELIPYRDVLSSCGLDSDQAYQFIMNVDPYHFILMQIFDYLTLNVDRNRDNFGLLRAAGKIRRLYPLFDHDSCFKARTDQAVYLLSRKTFANNLEYLKSLPDYRKIDTDQIRHKINDMGLKNTFTQYHQLSWYYEMAERADHL